MPQWVRPGRCGNTARADPFVSALCRPPGFCFRNTGRRPDIKSAVDATYRRALAAGGVSVQEPRQKDDPDRRGGVQDPAGNTWWIATQVG